jgi:replicative DNA helicase
MALLGATLADERQFDVVSALVSDRDFYRVPHQILWRAVKRLAEKRAAIDLITVKDDLARVGELDDIGGAAYIAKLIDYGRAANVETYAKIVREKALRRRAIHAAEAAIKHARESDEEASAVVDRAIAAFLSVSGEAAPHEVCYGPDIAKAAMDYLRDLDEGRGHGGVTGVPSGLPDLDLLTDGFQPGTMTIVGGNTSQGKTALAMQFAIAAAAAGTALIFSLEMTMRDLAMRALATASQSDGWLMRTGRLPAHQWRRVHEGLAFLEASRLAICDTSRVTVSQVRAIARRVQQQRGLRLLIVDYMQIMGVESGRKRRDMTRQEEVAAISGGLFAVAKDLRVPLVALSQLNKGDGTKNARPTLANLRESMSQAMDASVVLLIWRPDGSSMAQVGPAELIVAKNRNGPQGTVELTWHPHSTRFESASAQQPSGQQELPA